MPRASMLAILFTAVVVAVLLNHSLPSNLCISCVQQHTKLHSSFKGSAQRVHDPVSRIVNRKRNNTNAIAFDKLVHKFPFNLSYPRLLPSDSRLVDNLVKRRNPVLAFGSGGRELVQTKIKELAKTQDVVVVLEIGIWLGASTALWLNTHPLARVVGVDPFTQPNEKHQKVTNNPFNFTAEQRKLWGHPWFNRALAEHHVTTLAGESATRRAAWLVGMWPEAGDPLFGADGVGIDVFYIDGGKAKDTGGFFLSAMERVFAANPEAVICGDDWGNAEMESSVFEDFARRHGKKILVNNITWMMVDAGSLAARSGANGVVVRVSGRHPAGKNASERTTSGRGGGSRKKGRG